MVHKMNHVCTLVKPNYHLKQLLQAYEELKGILFFLNVTCIATNTENFKVVSRDPWKSRAKIAAFQYPTECSETSTETKEIPT